MGAERGRGGSRSVFSPSAAPPTTFVCRCTQPLNPMDPTKQGVLDSPTGFAEFVSDDFPVLHARRTLPFLLSTRQRRNALFQCQVLPMDLNRVPSRSTTILF